MLGFGEAILVSACLRLDEVSPAGGGVAVSIHPFPERARYSPLGDLAQHSHEHHPSSKHHQAALHSTSTEHWGLNL